MTEERDMLLDLLIKKAVTGLDDAEKRALDELDPVIAERELATLELTAAAISMAGLDASEPLPAHLRETIAADAAVIVGSAPQNGERPEPWPPAQPPKINGDVFSPAPSRVGWFGWLGWAAAAAACVVLGLNIWFTQIGPASEPMPEQAKVEPPRPPTPAELREELMRSGGDIIRANWAPGNVKDIKDVSGDIIWSEAKQTGFMRFHGLPANDASTTCYQLWIFDKMQDKATPIDGGIFDVTSEGEVIIQIDPLLKAAGPEMFAITIERHGGVVVSKREKIAALAKVETRAA
ncbi:MAG: anti-sigma factor [Pyrinomonadaceae bacterium]|nr:anti-sigma factor [Pyrinomonadaceae bacterium]